MSMKIPKRYGNTALMGAALAPYLSINYEVCCEMGRSPRKRRFGGREWPIG